MAFVKYPSITNKVFTGKEEALVGVAWVATPKFHGTNLSVVVSKDDSEVRYGRRNGFLLPTESHYGHERVMPALADWRRLLDAFPDAAFVTVFGEFYGTAGRA